MSAGLAIVGAVGLLAASSPRTIEDIYGDTGDFFKAAIAIRNDEKDWYEPDPAVSFGLAIDDAVLMWREFSLVSDAWNCAATGSCAVIDVQSANFYETRTFVAISLLETSPPPVNDCDLDGTIEPGEDGDCDDDGTRDLVARATSEAEPTGEIVVLDRIGSTHEYRGEVPISGRADAVGMLLLVKAGSENPTVVVTYFDEDDGTGQPCRNNVDPALWGLVTASTEVFAVGGSLTIGDASGIEITDNGDGDGFPDTNETIRLTIRVRNSGSTDVHAVSAGLTSSSPYIDCILDRDSLVGDIPAGQTRSAADPFTFRISAIDRTSLGLDAFDALAAEMHVTLTADEFDVATTPQSFQLDLDLDFQGGEGEAVYFESFEGGLAPRESHLPEIGIRFTAMNLDAGRHSLTASNGYRCQYQNPDDPDANSYGDTTCFLGGTFAQADRFFWQLDGLSSPDGGRAFTGTSSLYFGVFGDAPHMNTTPMGVLEAVASRDPIPLGLIGPAPELSFKHQISLLD